MTNYAEQEKHSVSWLQRQKIAGNLSPLGRSVACFLNIMWGMHHLNNYSLKKVNWEHDYYIEFVYDRDLCTVDKNDLTKLVVLAHQMKLRVSIEGAAHRYVRLIFHQRTGEKNDFTQRYPLVEDAVKNLTAVFPLKTLVGES
jgi:hypothetical protein